MTRVAITKTSFTGGELDRALFGRVDLRAYEEGAATLLNVLVRTSGGVTRRPGSRILARIGGAARLIPFESVDGLEILVLAPHRIHILDALGVQRQEIDTPWSEEQLDQVTWVRIHTGLLVCHPAIKPRRLERAADGTWSIDGWRFEEADDDGAFPRSYQPFARYAPRDVSIQAVAGSQSADEPIASGESVELRTSAPVFVDAHFGALVRIKERELQITSVLEPSKAIATVRQALGDGQTTRFWDEQAFGEARGWPACATQHQDRLVLGGAAEAPDYLWFSKTGRPFNFDLGSGLADEAIVFRLRADRRHAVRQLFAGRRLQVFTTAGEWIVSGSPLTPTNIQLDLQTRVGSPGGRQIAPVDVDGATLFVGASGRDLREFLFTNTEQAYQAADIAMLSRHLLFTPMDMAFDQSRRLFAIVRGDGAIACVTLDRNANIAAWSRLTTAGDYRAVIAAENRILTLVTREGETFLEEWDEALGLDHGLILESDTPQSVWDGVGLLDGKQVMVIADGEVLGQFVISGDSLDIGAPALRVALGLPFSHVVEPLPLASGGGRNVALDAAYRPVRTSFRLLGTHALVADVGLGPQPIALPANDDDGGFSGDIDARGFGWRRGMQAPPWRVAQDDPGSFTLLSVTTEIKVQS